MRELEHELKRAAIMMAQKIVLKDIDIMIKSLLGLGFVGRTLWFGADCFESVRLTTHYRALLKKLIDSSLSVIISALG